MSLMDEQSYPKLLYAIQESLKSDTVQSQRQQCEQYLQTIKQSSDGITLITRCVLDEFVEVSQTVKPYIKQLALILLNDSIIFMWEKLDSEQRLSIRNLLSSVLLLSQDSLSFKPIRIKIAVLFTNFAERQYPQMWESMVEDLLQIWYNQVPERQEIVMMIFEFLLVDCTDSDFQNTLSTVRKQDIINGLKSSQTNILNASEEFIKQCASKYRDAINDQSINQSELIDLLIQTLRLLIAFSSILSSTSEANTFPHHLFDLIIIQMQMLSIPKLQIYAMQFISILICQKSMTLEIFLHYLIRLANVDIAVFPDDELESIQFKSNYVWTILTFAMNNLHHLNFNEKEPPDHESLVRVQESFVLNIKKVIDFMSNPLSRSISSAVIKEWSKIFREYKPSIIIPEDLMNQIALSVLPVYINLIKRPTWIEYPNEFEPDDSFYVEYDSIEEWEDFFASFKSQTRLLIEIVTEKFAIPTLQAILECVKEQVSHIVINTSNPIATTIQWKVILLEWNNVSFLLSAATSSYQDDKKNELQNKSLHNSVWLQVLEVLLSIRVNMTTAFQSIQPTQLTPDSNAMLKVLLEYLKALNSFSFIINMYPESCLVIILNTYFDLINICQNFHHDLSQKRMHSKFRDYLLIRTKIFFYFVSTCMHCAVSITKLNEFSHIIQQMSDYISSSTSKSLKNSMRECLIVLANSIEIFDQEAAWNQSHTVQEKVAMKSSIIYRALSDILGQWTSEWNSDDPLTMATPHFVFSNVENLIRSCFIKIQPTLQDEVMTPVVILRELLNTIYVTMKRIPSPGNLKSMPLEIWSLEAVQEVQMVRAAIATMRQSYLAQTLLNESIQDTHESHNKEVVSSGLKLKPRCGVLKLDEYWHCEPEIFYNKLFPFGVAWQQILPAVLQGISLIHSLWNIKVREQLLSTVQNIPPGDDETTELLKGISTLYDPLLSDLIRDASSDNVIAKGNKSDNDNRFQNTFVNRMKVDLETSNSNEINYSADSSIAEDPPASDEIRMPSKSAKVSFELRELRTTLYLAFNLATYHYTVYFCPTDVLQTFLDGLSESFESMENIHLTSCIRNIIEPLILNALPQHFDVLATFIAKFLSHMNYRLLVIWQSENDQSNPIDRFIFNDCSLEPTKIKLPLQTIDSIRQNVVSELTRCHADTLAAWMSLRGQYSKPVYAVLVHAGSTTATNQTSNDRDQDHFQSIYSTELGSEEMDNQETLRLVKKRNLESFLFSPKYSIITRPLLASLVALICWPNSVSSKRALQIANDVLLLDCCFHDPRFYPVVSREAYNGALLVLLKQERWSEGMEWQLLDFMFNVYLFFIFGMNPQTGNNITSSMGSDILPYWHLTNYHRPNDGAESPYISIGKPISLEPRSIFLSIEGVTNELIEELEIELIGMNTKKKCRGVFKDFICNVVRSKLDIQAVSSSSERISIPSKIPKILDLPSKLRKRNYFINHKKGLESDVVDLSDLFPE